MSVDLLKKIIENPIPFAHSLGYTKLREDLHKDWIRRILIVDKNETLQAHRGGYKTSCLVVALVIWVITKPEENVIFLRKSQDDVKDVIHAVSKAIHSEVCMSLIKDIYGRYPKIIADSITEFELDVYRGKMGRQILGLGLKTSITGKHGTVITDDIVTLKDRLSNAERQATKSQYMELINVASEENQKIYNQGTPWHVNDAFSIMPEPKKYTIYDTGILSADVIQERRDGMSPSLFAANYELKHIANEDLLFKEPEYGEFPIGAKAYAQIDAAYGGADSNAVTIMCEAEGQLYAIGWKMSGHVEKYYNVIVSRLERYQAIECFLEDNADKGFLKRELEKRCAIKFTGYHEKMNKYYKISTYGKSAWKDVIIDMEHGDLEYIAEILDYNENADHDDCPDSFASLVRKKFFRKKKVVTDDSLNVYFTR